jgi:osmoprotectant transport system permease protein
VEQIAEQLDQLPELLSAHLSLTLLALFVSTVVSVPLGIASTRIPTLERIAVGTASVIQTVPGLAMLAMMVPILSALGANGIGYLPAIIGLTLYCIFPILMGTITGLKEVDPAMIEAARGVGMTDRQRLSMVELPLALPVIVSGLRTSTVWCVGMATLSTPVGAPSLGNYIFGGLQMRNYAAVLVGCVAAALLAQALDLLVRSVEVGLRNRRPRATRFGLVGIGALYGVAIALLLGTLVDSAGPNPVRVGAKAFTEQYVLAEILAQHIEAETTRPTQTVASLGSTVAFDALKQGEIDLYVDYSGTIWATVLDGAEVPGDRAEVLAEVGRRLEAEHGVVLVTALGFENAYCLAMRDVSAEELMVRHISDLGVVALSMSIGADFEFFERSEWRGIVETYGLEFAEQRVMDPSLMYEAIANESVDVIAAYTTDGRIDAFDLRILEDDRSAIPPYDAIVLASERLAREEPEVIAAIEGLEGAIDDDAMRALNREVDDEGKTARSVAEGFLQRWR